MIKKQEIYQLLEEKHQQFNRKSFIEDDPVSIPHLFTKKEDIEIAGFLSATIAWGQRKTIIKNATALMELMDMSPFDFVMNHNPKELNRFENFKHRTFNGVDAQHFIKALQHIYVNCEGLEKLFATETVKDGIHHLKQKMFEIEHPHRTQKHVSDPFKNSAAKRINMYLRWMVRKDDRGVDFGIWNSVNQKELLCPLDVHTANVSRKLGLLSRSQNDWKAVEELTSSLREFDPADPIKYDFSLFGLGIYDKF